MNLILYAIFTLSGVAALIFETLWFRQAGLTFGNSVWASSLVLSSFMAGIALGNGLAARYAARIARPLLAYALLELVIAIAGVGLVWTLPSLTGAIAMLLQPFFDHPAILNPMRLTVGFLLLLAPATAMGATLPLVVRALHARDPNFGSVLGKLYGSNTIGAMFGAMAGEVVLIELLGIRGTAVVAGGLGLTAAGVALFLARRWPELSQVDDSGVTATGRLSLSAWSCLVAAFFSGGILLALEVVWFRFLHLFAHGGSLAFALMLGTVLMGIGLGGYVGGIWIRRDPRAFRHAAVVAFLSGCVSVAVYRGFEVVIEPHGIEYVTRAQDILWLTFALTFPTSLLSGVLFTLVGAALEKEVSPDSRATGLLTLANTFGAGLGSLIAGFVLLPLLGMERSFFLLALLYGFVAVLLLKLPAQGEANLRRLPRWVAAIAFASSLFLFPSGMMQQKYLEIPVHRYHGEMSDVSEIREGVLQTILYLRSELEGELLDHRLVTDGYSMSSTADGNRRYMRLFVYWPVALRPEPKRALLISYGVGETAKALTDTASLEQIDVVDISEAILDSSDVLYPDPAEHPLKDPRVRVHIEDGRYFLRTTPDRFDLITGEPPPPKVAGVVSLYTREYFQLVYDRLSEGGINTYWLPVHNLTESDSKAIIHAYCDVFSDCALWSGHNLDWMLTGSRNATYAPSEEAFTRQWRDPVVGPQLRGLGIDTPELLGSLFMAGPERLKEFTLSTPPLVDNFPKRISNTLADASTVQTYALWMSAPAAGKRFRESEFIAAAWPAAIRERSFEQFEYQRILLETYRPLDISNVIQSLHRVLTQTRLQFVVIRLLGLTSDRVDAVQRLQERGDTENHYGMELAAQALTKRDYAAAAHHIGEAYQRNSQNLGLHFLRVYTLSMIGETDQAQALVERVPDQFSHSQEGQRFQEWLQETFGLEM